MSQFAFMNDLKTCLKMDDPITKGSVPRWQKKGLESSSSSLNISLNTSKAKGSTSIAKVKTPTKSSTTPRKTPKKTPKKSPGNRCNATTPTASDRFIPNRSATDFSLNHFKMVQQNQPPANEEITSPSHLEKQRIMAENLHGDNIENTRVLAFQNKAPLPPQGHQNSLKVVYSHSKSTPALKSSNRYIPQTPDRILDAPDILDDYYLNLIDWSASNILAVALNSSVYLWNAATGSIEQLLTLEGSDYVCSLAWTQDGAHLAVGTSMSTTQLWDCSTMRRLRVMDGHAARVCSLSWNQYILTSGSRSGGIIHHDVRQRDHLITTIAAHSQEVCGLKWSPDGRYLASGGNDNMVNIWSSVPGQMYSEGQPLYAFSQHQGAVKAVAWCPWHPNILASGGGTADRCIRFWNCNTGVCLNTVDTKSQVCALMWSTSYKEIISGHGYANNQLIIWKYPTMNKVAELTGHSARVLHLAMSPDGTTVLSAGADETLRLWKCFIPDPAKKKEAVESKVATSILQRGLR